jgi:hypothetical protein
VDVSNVPRPDIGPPPFVMHHHVVYHLQAQRLLYEQVEKLEGRGGGEFKEGSKRCRSDVLVPYSLPTCFD